MRMVASGTEEVEGEGKRAEDGMKRRRQCKEDWKVPLECQDSFQRRTQSYQLSETGATFK
jgi:hypothetical protein